MSTFGETYVFDELPLIGDDAGLVSGKALVAIDPVTTDYYLEQLYLVARSFPVRVSSGTSLPSASGKRETTISEPSRQQSRSPKTAMSLRAMPNRLCDRVSGVISAAEQAARRHVPLPAYPAPLVVGRLGGAVAGCSFQ